MLKRTIRIALRAMFALAIFYSFVSFCAFVFEWPFISSSTNPHLDKFFNRVLQFSVYAAGMPFGALGFILAINGIDTENSPILATIVQFVIWLLLIPMLSGAMAVWCDAILKRISTRNAMFFFAAFALLCSLNSLVSIDIMKQLIGVAVLRNFITGSPIPSYFMVFELPRIIMISVILGVTLGFFGLWEFIARRTVRRSSVNDTLSQS
jgi:hypothetical protein